MSAMPDWLLYLPCQDAVSCSSAGYPGPHVFCRMLPERGLCPSSLLLRAHPFFGLTLHAVHRLLVSFSYSFRCFWFISNNSVCILAVFYVLSIRKPETEMSLVDVFDTVREAAVCRRDTQASSTLGR